MSPNIKRYRIDYDGEEVFHEEHPNGEHVLYSDYEELQRRLDVLERAEKIWERRNGDASDLMDASQEASHYNWLDDQNEKLQKQLERAEEVLRYIAEGDDHWAEAEQMAAREYFTRKQNETNNS